MSVFQQFFTFLLTVSLIGTGATGILNKYLYPERVNLWDPQFRPMGRFFSVNVNNSLRGCTAQYVGPRLLLTAAHCLYSFGRFHTEMEFYQNYQGNETHPDDAIGTKRIVRRAFIDPKFHENNGKNFAYDIALVTMEDPSVGGFHFKLGFPDNFDRWISAGYPVDFLNGLFLMKFPCSKHVVSNEYINTPGSPMSHGASGGAWIAQRGSQFYAIGLNSFLSKTEKGVVGPTFNEAKIGKLMKMAEADLAKGRG